VFSIKEVLTVRISGKERKLKVKKLLYDLAHFRNLLIILINNYKFHFHEIPLNQSILYGLLTDKGYKGEYQREYKKVLNNINTNTDLKELLEKLRIQKKKVDNNYLVQYIIRQVIKDFKSYLKSLKEFKRNPRKFRGIPRSPRPKKLELLIHFSVEANTNTFKQEKDFVLIRLKEGHYLKVKLPRNFNHRVSSVRLKLFGDDIYADIVYECEFKEVEPKGNYRAGIDIGLDELLSVVSENPNLKSFIVSGTEIKSFNQWFNKEKAKLQSEIDRLKNENRKDKEFHNLITKMRVLSAYRRRWIDTQFHRISRKVVDILHKTGHKTIYIGKSALESKNGINLGKKTNQAFVFIPFRKLIEMIKYKAKKLGMEVIEVDESYTSKTSPFVDILKASETKEFGGERVGNLFKDRTIDKVFHADLVGALNIIRKGAKLPKLEFYNNLKILFIKLCNPVRLKLMILCFKVTSESLLVRGEIGGSKREIIVPAGLSLG